MSDTIINLIIQLIAGVLGGNGAGSALKDYSLGGLGNTIVGAIGGVGGGQALQAYPRWPGRPAAGSMWGLSSDNLSVAGRAALS